jgi:putative protease
VQEQEVGVVTHYFGKVSVGIIQLNGSLAVGDAIRIKGAHDDFTQTVESIQVEHQNVDKADKPDVVGIKVTQRVHENDRVYKIVE